MNRDELNQMMKQVQEMQSQMLQAQESLADERVEGTAGGGVVTATMNGGGELQGLTIDPKVVDPDDVEMLQDLVLAAINDASRRAQALQAERLGKVSGFDAGALGNLLGT